MVQHARSHAGQARWRREQQPNLLVVDAMKYVLQRHQRVVVDHVSVVECQEDRAEATHGHQERVEGGAELTEIAFTALVDQRADRFDPLGDLRVGVSQRRDDFDDPQQRAEGGVLFEIAAARAQHQARRSVGDETRLVQQGRLAGAPAALDRKTAAVRRDGSAKDRFELLEELAALKEQGGVVGACRSKRWPRGALRLEFHERSSYFRQLFSFHVHVHVHGSTKYQCPGQFKEYSKLPPVMPGVLEF